jgi:PLP dependent protein
MLPSETTAITANYQQVLERIAAAAHRAGRNPQDVHLIVVTKSQAVAAIQEVIAAGACDLGENYLDEAVAKIEALDPRSELNWHMIGHVQSRKAQGAALHFKWVHSLDRLKLAQRLDRFAGEANRKIAVLLECNVSGEETKFGWPAWNETGWPRLIPELEAVTALPNLQVRGLMTMAPFLPDPEQARPFFQRLHRLRDYLAEHLPTANWDELSMGMSADYEVAIAEGATMVRIGTAIMGQRA